MSVKKANCGSAKIGDEGRSESAREGRHSPESSMARFEIRLSGGTIHRERSVFVSAPIPFKQRSSHAANRISPTARFSGCARRDLGRASARPCAAGTAGTGGPLGNPVPPREGVQSTGRRDGNDRAGHAQGGYSEDRPGPGLLHRHHSEAVHRQRLFSATEGGGTTFTRPPWWRWPCPISTATHIAEISTWSPPT